MDGSYRNLEHRVAPSHKPRELNRTGSMAIHSYMHAHAKANITT